MATTGTAETTGATGDIICPLCGKAQPADQRFCGNCGTKLAAAPRAKVTETVVTTASAPVVSAPAVSAPSVSAPMLTAPAPSVPDPVALKVAAAAFATTGERDRERDRLLTLANVQRMRGQSGEARRSIETALALSEGLSNRALAPIHELRGDFLLAENKWDEARTAYEQAHELDSERVSAEKKFAETTLRIAEAKAVAEGSTLGIESETFGDGAFGGGARGKRNPGLALIMSLVVPGFGQLFNGELVKGGICAGVFVLALAAIALSPDGQVLFAKIAAVFNPGSHAAERASDPLSPLLIVLLALAGIAWLYSVIDAAAGATKSEAKVKGGAPPAGDRSGWEV